MGQALYRKYRSKSLDEIIGQEHITDTLSRALKNDTVSHAYLLTGPRGTGKTSIARILAYEVNKLPYDDNGSHMDIIEIDAASNRRIDEIREINDRVNIAPTSAKYKVYIIDEVHMLTKEAFNALLKTLEEPPAHAIFILATTEPHKVPETIISRTQRLTLKPIDLPEVTKHLQTIAKSENISINSDAMDLIATLGEGSFRDSISLLDQIRHISDQITLDDVQRAVGQAPEQMLQSVIKSISNHDIQAINNDINELQAYGIQASQISKQLSSLLRSELLASNSSTDSDIALKLLADLILVPASSEPAVALELALYKSALENIHLSDIAAPKPQLIQKESTKSAKITPLEATVSAEAPSQPKQPKKTTATKTEKTTISGSATSGSLDAETWQNVLNDIKTKQNTLYGIARMATPQFEADKLTLTFNFAFHHKRLSDAKNRDLIIDTIQKITGKHTALEIILDKQSEPAPAKPTTAKETKPTDLNNISNIFGGAEIVE